MPPAARPRRLVSRLLRALVVVCTLLPVLVWAPAAIWFDGPASRATAGSLAAAWCLLLAGVLLLTKPWWRSLALAWALFALLLSWWLAIPPSNTRDWAPDVAQLPGADIDGNRVTVHGVRNFEYASGEPVAERWETRTYDLDHLVGFDLFMSYWGPTLIAHTIASWEFDDGRHLAISIETRKEVGEEYSAIAGFFRQFEVYYVVADERDVIGVRAAERGETLYLYRLQMPPGKARELLLSYLREINRLTEEPRWYNALTFNCTTAIRWQTRQIEAARPWDWKLLVNGYLDELGYERGQINTSLPFPELRARSDVTEKARAAIDSDDFSTRIREGLPDRPH